jgi:hypothetical protein
MYENEVNAYVIIRDLGYFALKVFKQVALLGAFFLSRYHYTVNLYDPGDRGQLELGKVLRGSAVDRQVVAGKKEKLLCRLAAV